MAHLYSNATVYHKPIYAMFPKNGKINSGVTYFVPDTGSRQDKLNAASLILAEVG